MQTNANFKLFVSHEKRNHVPKSVRNSRAKIVQFSCGKKLLFFVFFKLQEKAEISRENYSVFEASKGKVVFVNDISEEI